MSLVPYIFDHVDRRIARIVSKLTRAARFVSLVRMYAEELQELEDSLFNLIAERTLDASQGAQLDQWGLLVGEPRNWLTDGEYRAFIGARIATNLSEGTVDNMTAILATLGRATLPVMYHPLYPAAMQFSYVTDAPVIDSTAARLQAQMIEAAPAGVDIAFIVEAPTGYFGFDLDPDSLGFDDGEFARVLP